MQKYYVTIHYTDTVEAESADAAVNAVFEELDSESNMSLTNTLARFHTTVTPVASGPKQEKKKGETCWASIATDEGDKWCRNKELKNGYCKKHQYLVEK